MNDDPLVTSKEKERNNSYEQKMIIREKEMKISQIHRAALIATNTIDSAPRSASQRAEA